MRTYDYDVLVIGAGIAGLVAAVTANGLGQRVGIVEKRRFGGNCTSFTCIPSKALIRVAHVTRQLAHLEDLGLGLNSTATVNTDSVMSRVRDVVSKAYSKDVPETFERIGIHVLAGSPEFVDRHHVRLNGSVFSSRRFILAMGTRPLIPPIEGIERIGYLTNETVFELDALPGSLIILGGGVDGLEFASAFSCLGVGVTIVEMAPRILPGADEELADLLRKQMELEGVKLLVGTRAVNLSSDGQKKVLTVESAESRFGEVQADAVLTTVGRKANVEGLSLEKAGVTYSPKGIATDHKLRTSARNIYACGDIVGPYQLASIAEYQGIVAATNAVLPFKKRVDYKNSVFVIFTEPTLAFIGLSEKQAREQYGDSIKVYRFDYGQMRRALIDGAEAGMAKFVCDRRGILLGAHILGEAAAEVIHEVQVIKAMKQPLHNLHMVTHAYPTYAQAMVGRASQLAYLDRMEGNTLVKLLLKLLPGYENRLSLARQRLAETQEPVLYTEEIVKKESVGLKSDSAPSKEVRVKSVRVSDDVCIVKMPPEITDHDETPVLMTCTPTSSESVRSILLDFSGVERMNGLGASMLVKLGTKSRSRECKLMVYGLNEHYRNVFRVTGLDEIIGVYESESQALLAAGETAGTSAAEMAERTAARVESRDKTCWAQPVDKLKIYGMPPEAVRLNVEGRRPVGPVEGFGQMWQKTYRQALRGTTVSPAQAIDILKRKFPEFQPSENRFYPTEAGIKPGEVIVINSKTPGGPVFTAVIVLYADDESFTFITPQGHPEAGWVTFSAFEREGCTVIQIQGLARANDPVYEIAFLIAGSKVQERIWRHVLTSMATYVGTEPAVEMEKMCVDTGRQWSKAGNIWYNAQIRSMIYTITAPFRRLNDLLRRQT